MTLITSPVTEVLEHESLSHIGRENLILVRKNTERMLRLVNQILDFRKIQNQKMKVLVEQTDVNAYLQKITENFRQIAHEKRIDFHLKTNNTPLFAWIDRDKFEKIFFNLLSNAFKYTPSRKAITITVDKSANSFTVSVKDEGVGIDPKKLQVLFQRFETLAQSNMLQPSSGIGLSLVHELIELHHGNIEVKSELHKGSEFIVTLPLEKKIYQEDKHTEFILSDENATTPATAASVQKHFPVEEEIPAYYDDNTLTILIVEDNQELRKFLFNTMSTTYRILEATNGQEGLELAQSEIPDLIISDVMMPVMDGLDMVKEIKNNNNTCHIPIIILSAKSSLDDRIAGLEQGIDDYITKPFSSTYLKARILSLFRQRAKLQELYLSQLSIKKEKKTDTKTFAPSLPQITPYDNLFMEQVMAFMEEQMSNSELTVDDFANKLFLSRSIFYRKLKSIVGVAPIDFIRDMRIKRAGQLIESGEYNFSQVAYMTGFTDPKYFSKSFKKQMGMTPTEYKEQHDRSQ